MISVNGKNLNACFLRTPGGKSCSVRSSTRSAKVRLRILQIPEPKALNLESACFAEPWKAGSSRTYPFGMSRAAEVFIAAGEPLFQKLCATTPDAFASLKTQRSETILTTETPGPMFLEGGGGCGFSSQMAS